MKNLKKSHKIIINIIVIGFILIWFLFKYKDWNHKNDKVIKDGFYFTAIINRKSNSSGGTSTLDYFFIFNHLKIKSGNYVNDDFYNKKHIGDTIIIKTHKDLLPFSIVCEDLVYKSCMGKPPKGGWKEIPSCNDK